MVGAVSSRIWTDQATNKEFQWLGANQNSTTTGNWGLTDFDTDAQTRKRELRDHPAGCQLDQLRDYEYRHGACDFGQTPLRGVTLQFHHRSHANHDYLGAKSELMPTRPS